MPYKFSAGSGMRAITAKTLAGTSTQQACLRTAYPSSLVPPGVWAVSGMSPSANRAPNTFTMLSRKVAPPVLDNTVLRAPLPT